jgi:hypothetical protein
MSYLTTKETREINILIINSEREELLIHPDYQRRGDIWDLGKKQLFIDSILNKYDIPKLYFHVLKGDLKKKYGEQYTYAVIDGRQRIQAIWEFIDGKFPLSDEFQLFSDKTVDAKNLKYFELAEKYPRLKRRFDAYPLPIVEVETDDPDLIEDLFSRLNEAVPLSSAEHRNAIGGPLAKLIRETADTSFFKEKVKISNKRYQHREVAARLLFIEHSLVEEKRIIDTKKIYLDAFVKKFRNKQPSQTVGLKGKIQENLDLMNQIFEDHDNLLQSQGIIPIYYLLVRELKNTKYWLKLTRDILIEFNDKVKENKENAAKNIEKANYELLDFDKMSIQGTNDAISIRERTRILRKFITGEKDLDWN